MSLYISEAKKPVKEVTDEPFWDVVVLTAVDSKQKSVYEKQLEEKFGRNELPLGIPFHIVADPEGPKIGIILDQLMTCTFY